MLFIGQYDHTIDAKGRLAIPADVRWRWSPKAHGGAWYAVPWPDGAVRLYTETQFEARAAGALPQTLTPSDAQAKLQALLFGAAARMEMDSAGRIRIPDAVIEVVGLGSEVVIVGCGDRFEVRDRAQWKKDFKERLAGLPELLRATEAERGRGA